MPHCFYVYYKIEPANELEARIAVNALLVELFRREGIAGRLLKRADTSHTWMEIYEGVTEPVRFRIALESTALNSGLQPLLCSQRHIEHFRDAIDVTSDAMP